MELKDNKIIIYEIDKNYLNYLSQFDKNVRIKSDRRYTGILVNDNNSEYCIPLTCKIKKRSPKLTINITDGIKNIAQLTINNMIPVKDDVVSQINIQTDKDKSYLMKELSFLRKNKTLIIKRVDNVFNVLNNQNHSDYIFFKSLCADFNFLESKCNTYKKKQ